MTPTDLQTLLRAAESLREEANLHRESCELNGRDWQCQDCPGDSDNCPTHKRYDDLTDLANRVSTLAA